jgi:invasion protein IalB
MRITVAAVAAIALGLSAAAWVPGARAEDAGKADAAEKPPEPEFTPRGKAMPRDIKYSAWHKLCFKSSDGKVICRTSLSGTWQTGQTAVRVYLIERAGGKSRMQIFLPVGLYLQAGVKLAVDEHKPVHFPYSWCLTNMCIAANLASPELIHAMETGKKLTLEVVDNNLLTVASSLPLDHFATVHKGEPEKTYDFDQIDKD